MNCTSKHHVVAEVAMRTRSTVPDLLPRLSAGKHRSPKRGACFMEFASYLAGERWSDHPACTDPLLSSLARGVNDAVGDERRGELVTLIPRVVGLRGDDANLGLVVALRAAACALPIVSMDRQRSLAVGILAIRAAMTSRGLVADDVVDAAVAALHEVPDAAAFAERQFASLGARESGVVRFGCAAIVRIAVLGVAEACVSDYEDDLIAMLELAVTDVEALIARTRPGSAQGGDQYVDESWDRVGSASGAGRIQLANR